MAFLRWRVRPIARKLGIPDRLVTFQVMRRTLGTDMQQHGTLKDTQSLLRHASIKTTGDVYVQTVEQSVLQAVNSRTAAVLEGCTAPVKELGVKGRNLKGMEAIRRSRKRRRLLVVDFLAPQVGLEPTTLRLTAECSAIELLRNA